MPELQVLNSFMHANNVMDVSSRVMGCTHRAKAGARGRRGR
jgi:hypothetical protein